uniref:Uncharacterized protein n=1 Tax=Candidatus Kentrum sp. FM TaxID=2126340 RepID=A0A450S9Y9_9GAMM|nr:MAG: hypothetical protein BECKFM1743C_GA0114222_100417 [Candidatus Kentron sp. FM]VFJ48923.1 MAG: hypothetical protein BECKFM1743A_GA0114220_1006411 [Candidatus Kentron sp. FM]VFK08232.1 MAG: hypothetical protein BECKFM1743B_GA0114221_1006310 [Candidatus Kentron sp. FM]
MQLTVNVPEELAGRLVPLQDQIPDILSLGLRELDARNSTDMGFEGVAHVLDFLAGIPGPEEILALRPGPVLQKTIGHLLEKNRTEGLDAREDRQWRQYEYLEHLVRKAKISARKRLAVS